jgi:zinc protease
MKNRVRMGVLLTCALALLSGCDRDTRQRPTPIGPGAFTARIPNGPRVLFMPQSSVPVFSCTVLVPAGSALETPETNGAAHYLEHLLFNGTKTRTREEIYALTDRLGAYNNASTQRERMVFQMLLPSENWREGLALQADMLLDSTLPPEMFEKEQGIILEELAKDRSDPAYAADLLPAKSLFAGDARAMPVLGTEKSIAGMDLQALATFYRERFHPAGMTIIAMGDFECEALLAELNRLYGRHRGEVPPPLPRPPFPTRRSIDYLEAPQMEKIQVRVMLRMPSVLSREFPAAQMLADILSSGERSALTRAVEATCGTPLSIGASLEPGVPWSTLAIAADLPVGTTGGEAGRTRAPAVGAILAHLERIAEVGVDAVDLETARLAHTVGEISMREKMHYYAFMRADLLGAGGPTACETLLAEVGRVTTEDVRTVLFNGLLEGHIVCTAAGPGMGEGSEHIPDESWSGALSWLEPPREASDERRTLGEAPASASETTVRRMILENGLTLILHSSPAPRTFAAHALFRDRAAMEIAQGVPLGTSDVLHRMLELGTAKLSEDELRGKLAALGASLQVTDLEWIPYDDYYFTPEFSYVRLETIDLFASEALALLGEVLFSPRFTQDALAKAVAAAAARAEKDRLSPSERSSELFYAALGKNHPLSRGVLGEPKALRALSLRQIRKFHAAYMRPANLILSISTSLPPAVIEEGARAAFGPAAPAGVAPATTGAGASPPAAPEFIPARIEGRLERSVELNRRQSYLRVGAPVAAAGEDGAPLRLACGILSERLADQLREREGLAYSIGASLRLEEPGPAVQMRAGTRPENLVRMEEGMREIARSLTQTPPTDEEVEGARNRGEGRSRMRRMSRIGLAYALGLAEFRGENPENLDADLPRLRAVTAADVKRAAERYLDFESSICAIAK